MTTSIVRGLCIWLMVSALSPALASVQIDGVLSTGSHQVAVELVMIMDEAGNMYTFPTPDWQGESLALDTFEFPPIEQPPLQIDLSCTVDGVPEQVSIPTPIHDSWYIIPSPPTEAMVKFLWLSGIEDNRQSSSRPAILRVRPGIVTGTATVEAARVGVGRCEVEIYDALGNRVRVLTLQGSGEGAFGTWCGEDDRGRQLPEGIYYCTLKGAANPTVRKLVLTR